MRFTLGGEQCSHCSELDKYMFKNGQKEYKKINTNFENQLIIHSFIKRYHIGGIVYNSVL
jgi:hypothetical protein